MVYPEPHTPDLSGVKSETIRWIVKRAIARGARVTSLADWSKALVAHMDSPLPPDLKAEIEAAWPELQYYSDRGSPHNAPDEGYIEDGFAVSFPAPRQAPIGGPPE